jgi:hypothetical protein
MYGTFTHDANIIKTAQRFTPCAGYELHHSTQECVSEDIKKAQVSKGLLKDFSF